MGTVKKENMSNKNKNHENLKSHEQPIYKNMSDPKVMNSLIKKQKTELQKKT